MAKIAKRQKPVANINKTAWLAVMLLPIFLYMWAVSFLTPMMVDDFQMAVNSTGRWFDPALIWHQFVINYFNESGRIGILFWAFSLLSFGRLPFYENGANFILAGINGAVFVLFLWLCYIMAFGQRPNFAKNKDRLNWFWLFLLSMIIIARKGETYFWISGYVMYLWSITLLFAFGVFYRLLLSDKNMLQFKKNNWQKYIFIIFIALLGFLAGMTFEIGGIITIALLLGVIGYQWLVARQQLPAWVYIGAVAFVVGYAVLMVAPGNYVRLGDPFFAAFNERSFIDKLERVPHMLRLFITRLRWVPPIILLFAFYHWQKNSKAAGKKSSIIEKFIAMIKKDKLFATAVIFFVASLASASAVAFSPVKDARVFFLATVLFMVSFLLAIDYLFTSGILSRRVKQIIFVGFALLLVCWLVRIGCRAYEYHNAFEAREVIIKQQKENGVTHIVVPPMNLKTNFWINDGSIKSDWVKKAWSDYYGVASMEEK
ncbi:MAG: DUF6056 family protein [Hydrotalea sp.]|nr:DUF6056 family protein [Hydrotalea sp.]